MNDAASHFLPYGAEQLRQELVAVAVSPSGLLERRKNWLWNVSQASLKTGAVVALTAGLGNWSSIRLQIGILCLNWEHRWGWFLDTICMLFCFFGGGGGV